MENYLDLLFFALVAFFFFSRLWSVLGRKDDQDENPLPPLHNPFAQPDEKDNSVIIPGKSREIDVPPVVTPSGYAIASLAGSIERLKAIDSDFDEKQFIEGAKIAFTTIVEAFAKGDLAPVSRLLSPAVRSSFESAIVPDLPKPSTPRVTSISDAVLSAVDIDSNQVRLTVEFTSLQSPASAHGQVVEMHDKWIFARAIDADNPNWILIAT